MKFIIVFTDAPDAAPDIRKTHMPAHLAFLEAHSGEIEAAGPLSDPEAQGRDGLWVVEAQNQAAVEALIREDPFWPTGLRGGHLVIPWTQVFANGKRLIG